jgi:hypothetical protein
MNIFEAINATLKNNEHLSGWAQFLGAMIALGVTYLTANLPIWAMQRQERDRLANLDASAKRLLDASAKTSQRAAILLTISGYGPINAQSVAYVLAGSVDALERFPVHDLADQSSPNSLAARIGYMVSALRDAMHAVQTHASAVRETWGMPDEGRTTALQQLMDFNVTVTAAIAKGVEPVFTGPSAEHQATAQTKTSSPDR